MSVFLDEYLRLEQEMLRLDAMPGGGGEADELRDFMDVVWRRLAVEQRKLLNQRAVVAPVSRPHLSVHDPGFLSAQRELQPLKQAPAKHLTVPDAEFWCAA